MSTLSPTSASRHPDRAPPPSLFLGPPSRNASAVSLTQPSHPSRDPLLRTRSARVPPLESKPSFIRARATAAPPQPPAQSEGDRTDALWAEMQATLAEVELSAFSSTHVFGQAHLAALEELRAAQVQLARAWGRSEEGDGDEVPEENGKEKGEAEGGEEVDIAAARRRREANERFFEKVQEGVADVVGKLETVAAAMGKVERESRSIWSSGSDSLDTSSTTS